jgi:uncharacterized delta-60 repeat protein
MRRMWAIFFLVLLMTVVFARPTLAAPGDLDTAFSGDGKVTTAFDSPAFARALAIQSNGKIVVAGIRVGAHDRFALARYNPDGSLDVTFSGNGKVTTRIGFDAHALDVAIQPNGKIVVAGDAFVSGHDRFALARYNLNGSLDSTFSGDGKVTTLIGSGGDGRALAIQSNGKIVVAGDASVTGHDRFALARYNPDGSLDSTFSGNGKRTTLIGSGAGGRALAIQSDGKIVVAGRASVNGHDRFALARYDLNGSLDSTFHGDGKVATRIGFDAVASALTIQSGGKIVVAGDATVSGHDRFALARYNLNGTLDTTFSGDAKVTTLIGSDAEGSGVAIQTDGKIDVAGGASVNGHDRFALARYAPNGDLDSTLSGDGKVATLIGSDAHALDVAIQSGGKIVAAGDAFVSGHDRFAAARYLP